MKKGLFFWTLLIPYIEVIRVIFMFWCNKHYELFGNMYPGILLIVAMFVGFVVISTVVFLFVGYMKRVALDEIDELMIRHSMVLKITQLPAIIVLIVFAVICTNPNLILLSLLLIIEIATTILISSMMGQMYIIHLVKQKEMPKKQGILYGALILLPIVGIVIAYKFFKEILEREVSAE